MMGLVYQGPHKLEFQDVPRPVVGGWDVLVRVKACAICGSDVHGYEGITGRRTPPMIMGHEFGGLVEEIGRNVTGLKPGDRVLATPSAGCGHCEFCQVNRPEICRAAPCARRRQRQWRDGRVRPRPRRIDPAHPGGDQLHPGDHGRASDGRLSCLPSPAGPGHGRCRPCRRRHHRPASPADRALGLAAPHLRQRPHPRKAESRPSLRRHRYLDPTQDRRHRSDHEGHGRPRRGPGHGSGRLRGDGPNGDGDRPSRRGRPRSSGIRRIWARSTCRGS